MSDDRRIRRYLEILEDVPGADPSVIGGMMDDLEEEVGNVYIMNDDGEPTIYVFDADDENEERPRKYRLKWEEVE